jgi:hypothetical protein
MLHVRYICILTACTILPALCWTPRFSLYCGSTVNRNNLITLKVREAATKVSTGHPKILGSRRLHQWIYKPKTPDHNQFENEARFHELELVKLIAIARLHTEVVPDSTGTPVNSVSAQVKDAEVNATDDRKAKKAIAMNEKEAPERHAHRYLMEDEGAGRNAVVDAWGAHSNLPT